MSPRQIIVLVGAAIAAICALLLIRGMGAGPAPAPQEQAAVAGVQVLIAAKDIAQGVALTPGDIGVATFPEQSITPAFISVATQPSAQADYVGAVTRRTFSAGEPLIVGSVVQPEGRSFMAAQLEPGYRAVAVEIEPKSAAGGFIQPNDRVDVIVSARGNGNERATSNIILEDVRVLAMGDKMSPEAGDTQEVSEATVAVLELSAADARVVELGRQMGDLSLALRSVQADTVAMASRRRTEPSQSGGVRLHSFGEVSGEDQ